MKALLTFWLLSAIAGLTETASESDVFTRCPYAVPHVVKNPRIASPIIICTP